MKRQPAPPESSMPKWRGERLHIATWLQRPKRLVSREEAYLLLREYEYMVQRRRWRYTLLGKVLIALGLVLSAPVRIPWQRWKRRKEGADGEGED